MSAEPHIIRIDEAQRAVMVSRGRALEYLTVGWNVIEGIVAIASGAIAGSVSLIGFGIDSLIEVSSGCVMIWRLRSDHLTERREQIEQRAIKLVGVCFLLLAAYVAFDALKSLIVREQPEKSFVGIGLAVLSLIVMPLLARAKRRVGRQIRSRAMEADSRQTDICAYLSAILLVGLGLNALFGWWWADPIAALVMAPIILKEGIDALRGEACGCSEECG